MKKILVTGANGQLGLCFKTHYKVDNTLDFVFLNSEALDITNSSQINTTFNDSNFDYCINCAAYTAVDNAEDDKERAYSINVLGTKNLADACKKYNVILIHVSTDFVFDGKNTNPYKENDITNPLGVYGHTKLEGEKAISLLLEKHYIIRTSWLYSEFGNNFVKTMLKLASERDELSVVNDQNGTPTNAHDLAMVIIKIINSNKQNFGLYHFSNLGETTWYGFAKAIFELANTTITLKPIHSEAFITKAQRPKYSVLDKTKICSVFNLEILDWKKSLEKTVNTLTSYNSI